MQQGLILLVACTEILQEFMSQPHYLLHLGVFRLCGRRNRKSIYCKASTPRYYLLPRWHPEVYAQGTVGRVRCLYDPLRSSQDLCAL